MREKNFWLFFDPKFSVCSQGKESKRVAKGMPQKFET
jgi:hypothetical protein